MAAWLFLLAWTSLGFAQEASWPDLSSPARAVGGGEHDAAVVVGVENYLRVPSVPGAQSNARQWYEYLTETRGVPAQNVKFLINDDATREEMLDASRKMAGRAGPEGTLWFVFVGHGAPSPDGKDGLLIGVDAQQKAESLEARGLRRQELLKTLVQSKAGTIVAVLDACFSGRGQDGAAIVSGLQPLVTVAAAGAVDPRMVVLTAAKGNQFAGALPGASRPAFSYLVLGGLRGWAAEGKHAALTAGGLWRYASNALEATLRGRNQTPDLLGREDKVVGASAGEKGPSLAKLAAATAGGAGAGREGARKGIDFQVTSLPDLPKAEAPKELSQTVSGLGLDSVDVDSLEKYDAAVNLDKSEAAPEVKAEGWRSLAKKAPAYADLAQKRAAEWDSFAETKRIAEKVREQRAKARDGDWKTLERLLTLGVVPQADKDRWADQFKSAYSQSPGLTPAMMKALGITLSEPPAPPTYKLAWEQFHAGDYTKSVQTCREFVSQHEYHPLAKNAYLILGNALLKLNQPTEAITAFRRVIDLGPSSDAAEQAILTMVQTQYQQKAYQSILTSYYFLFRHLPPSRSKYRPLSYLYAAEACRMLDRKEESKAIYEMILKVYPDDMAATYARSGLAWIRSDGEKERPSGAELLLTFELDPLESIRTSLDSPAKDIVPQDRRSRTPRVGGGH